MKPKVFAILLVLSLALVSAGTAREASAKKDVAYYRETAASCENAYAESRPPRPDLLYSAAVCRFQAKEFQKALSIFNQLITAHPKAVSCSQKELLVHILFSLEFWQQTLPVLEGLALGTAPPKQKQWQEVLLHQYLFLKMDQRAQAYAESLTRTDPLEPKWWKALCHIHLNQNQLKKGLTALIIYGYLTPMTQEDLQLTADLYRGLNLPDKAAQIEKQINPITRKVL